MINSHDLLLFFGVILFAFSFAVLCYNYSKELFVFIMIRAFGERSKAVIKNKENVAFGPRFKMIEFAFLSLEQEKVDVMHRVTTKSYNTLVVGQEIEILHLKHDPKIARITNIPGERGYLGYQSAFFFVATIAFFPIAALLGLFLSIEIIRYLWLLKTANDKLQK